MEATTAHGASRTIFVVVALISVMAAIGAAASLALVELLERRWSPLDCSESSAEMLERFQWAAIVLAAVAVLSGFLALFGRTARASWFGVAGIAGALIVVALMFLPTVLPKAPSGLQDIGSFQCGVGTP